MTSEELAGLWFDLSSGIQKTFAKDRGLTRDMFIEWATKLPCDLHPVTNGGRVVGVMALCGKQVHVAVLDGKLWMRQFQRFLENAFQQGKELSCMTLTADSPARGFIERAGCKMVEQDDMVTRYRIIRDDLWYMKRGKIWADL